MNLQEAIAKADKDIMATPALPARDPYAISFEDGTTAKSLVGKTLRSRDPKNTNVLEIVKWVGQSYVVRINSGDNYDATPVVLALQNLRKFIVEG